MGHQGGTGHPRDGGDTRDQVTTHAFRQSADALTVPSLSLRRSRGMTCIFGETKTQRLQETQCSVSVKKNKIYPCGSVIAAVSQQLPDKSALSTETTSFSNKQYII